MDDGPPRSVFPAAASPVLGLVAYSGDLGMDGGAPQSVYVLDKSRMNQITMPESPGSRFSLVPGELKDLPGDAGSIEFVGLRQYARLQVSSSPGAAVPLFGAAVGLLGLCLSLAIRPRRIWVRPQVHDGVTHVEIGALSRLERGDTPMDVEKLVLALGGCADRTSP